MAVTRTYQWQVVKALDADGFASPSDMIALAGGGFLVIGLRAGSGIDAIVYNAQGVRVDDWPVTLEQFPEVVQLAGGNVVLAASVNDAASFGVYTTSGATVIAPTPIGATYDTVNSPAVSGSLADGRFVVAAQVEGPSTVGLDILVSIRNADGGSFLDFTLNTGSLDYGAQVVALSTGGFAVVWRSGDPAGSSVSRLWYAVYSSSGAVQQSTSLLDGDTVQGIPSVTALAGGRFAVAYTPENPDRDARVAVLTPDGFGGYISDAWDVSQNSIYDQTATIAALSNGLLVVAYSSSISGSDTVVRLVHPDTGQILATHIFDADFAYSPAVAGFGLGRVALFDSASNQARGQDLGLVRTSLGDGANDVIVGDDFIDNIDGAGGADTLEGGANDDAIYGGAGEDTARYASAASGVTVRLAVTTRQNTGGAGADILGGIENLEGSAFADTLTGDGAANRLTGGSGDDKLYGGLGNDTLNGGNNADTLDGGAGDDAMFGGAGNDGMRGSGGADHYDGGAGVDVVNFDVSGGVNVFLDGSGTNGAGAVGDTFVNVENLIGGIGPDFLVGNGADNRFTGGTGNDRLWGRGGIDQLEGGAGSDRLWGGPGNDILVGGLAGGTESDTFIFADAPALGGFDRTADFTAGTDKIEIDASLFGGGLTAGGSVRLVANGTPSSAGVTGGVFLYDTDTGFLSWDADGGGSGAAVNFFRLQNLPALSAGDFLVVA